MEPFPTDVTTDIFSRLPAKSVARFRSLSKLWCSILSRPDFAELFLIRSCARPRLLFAVKRYGQWSFFSSPQPQYPYDKSSSSSLVVAADFHTKFSADVSRYICSCYASGLIHFPDMWIPRDNTGYSLPVICNPITGKYVSLPEPVRYEQSNTEYSLPVICIPITGKYVRDFLGFDPIEKQFKVLAEAYPFSDHRNHHQILTLETGKQLSWTMKNHCPLYESSLSEGICINGVLYYLARNMVIVCFDVRSEEFKFIEAECFSDEDTTKLVSYKGKLGGINWKYAIAGGRCILELCLWVLEDIEKQEWLNHVYTLSEGRIVDRCNFSVVGMTATGEIVLSMDYTSKPFYVCYFHPERKTLTSVEIQGFGALEKRGRVHVFVDHVEDLSVNDAKQLKSSISAHRWLS